MNKLMKNVHNGVQDAVHPVDKQRSDTINY